MKVFLKLNNYNQHYQIISNKFKSVWQIWIIKPRFPSTTCAIANVGNPLSLCSHESAPKQTHDLMILRTEAISPLDWDFESLCYSTQSASISCPSPGSLSNVYIIDISKVEGSKPQLIQFFLSYQLVKTLILIVYRKILDSYLTFRHLPFAKNSCIIVKIIAQSLLEPQKGSVYTYKHTQLSFPMASYNTYKNIF